MPSPWPCCVADRRGWSSRAPRSPRSIDPRYPPHPAWMGARADRSMHSCRCLGSSCCSLIAFRNAAMSGCGPAVRARALRPNSPQRCRVGTALPGLSRSMRVERVLDGVEALELGRRELYAHRIDSFSTPTPCSPVIVPPTSMHSPRMRSPNSIVFAPSHPACWRRTGSTGAGCRRRRGTHSRTARPNSADHCGDLHAARAAARRAESCRRCSSSRARFARRPGTRPCVPTSTTGAGLRPSTRRISVAPDSSACGGSRPSRPRLPPACRRTRPAARRPHPADSSRARTARPRASRLVHHFQPAGMMPARDDRAPTAAPACSTSAKAASATCASCGLGNSLTVISVITASRPSLPVMSARRS